MSETETITQPPKDALSNFGFGSKEVDELVTKLNNSGELKRRREPKESASEVLKRIAADYKERFFGKIGHENINIHIADEEKDEHRNLTDNEGIRYDVKMRVWLTDTDSEEKTAFCYKLVKDQKGDEIWFVEDATELSDESTSDTNVWKLREPRRASVAEVNRLKNNMEKMGEDKK